MNTTNIGWRVILSLGSYIFVIILIVVTLRQSTLQEFVPYALVGATLLMIRDIIVFLGIPKKIRHMVIDWSKIRTDIQSSQLSRIDIFIILNRIFLFPIILVTYIIVILLKQLDILGMLDILSSNSWIEYTLLGLVAITGVSTVLRESLEDRYQKSLIRHTRTRLLVWFSIVLSVLAVVIVFIQTTTLGLLALPISLISGLLIFLVGIMLLEDGKG